MNPTSLQEIYAAKSERRKQLAALSIEERVALIDKLHEFGLLMRKAREDHAKKTPPSSSPESR